MLSREKTMDVNPLPNNIFGRRPLFLRVSHPNDIYSFRSSNSVFTFRAPLLCAGVDVSEILWTALTEEIRVQERAWVFVRLEMYQSVAAATEPAEIVAVRWVCLYLSADFFECIVARKTFKWVAYRLGVYYLYPSIERSVQEKRTYRFRRDFSSRSESAGMWDADSSFVRKYPHCLTIIFDRSKIETRDPEQPITACRFSTEKKTPYILILIAPGGMSNNPCGLTR